MTTMTVDWTKPIEAVRESDGKIFPVDDISMIAKKCKIENTWHDDDGNRWRIRNVVEEIPEWAIERAKAECVHIDGIFKSFARYIAQHEEGPVDEQRIEARQICESFGIENPFGEEESIALAALRRGIEIGKEQK